MVEKCIYVFRWLWGLNKKLMMLKYLNLSNKSANTTYTDEIIQSVLFSKIDMIYKLLYIHSKANI